MFTYGLSDLYQQDFHVAPNPRKIIQLDASGKQGRYVRIQLLDKDYLSLAEVNLPPSALFMLGVGCALI
jgi:hypothetical protein